MMCSGRSGATRTGGGAGAPSWLGCVLAVVAASVAPAAAAAGQDAQTDPDVAVLIAAGLKPDAAGIGAYLKDFLPNAAHAKRVARLVKDLGSEEFEVRQAASKALAALPLFPRAALEEAARSNDLEVRTRAKALLERGQGQGQRTLAAALAVVAGRKITGLAAEVLAAGAHCPPSDRLPAVTGALSATVVPADAGMLRRALGSKAAWRRSAAAAALDHLLADKAGKDLLALLKDPDDDVRLTAGRLLINRGNRAGLVSLAKLLASEDHAIRWASSQALQWLVGKTFDYDAFAKPGDRKAAAAKWLTWARGPGQKAKLRIPIKAPSVVQLFNGANLSSWKAVDNGRDANPKTHWQVKNGVLRCTGTGRGYLYHKQPRTNYELIVEWRWPEGPGDSGVWFLMAKPGGQRPACIEAQLLSGKAGDFWIIGNLAVTVRGQPARSHVVKTADSSEKPVGQWNRMTIRVLNGTVDVKVNGVQQNTAADCPRTPGHVALQTEGDAIEFRKVQLRPLGR